MRLITASDYELAIKRLRDAMTQLEPDGQNCAICEDSGHQAFECRFNVLAKAKRYDALIAGSAALHEELHSALRFEERSM